MKKQEVNAILEGDNSSTFEAFFVEFFFWGGGKRRKLCPKIPLCSIVQRSAFFRKKLMCGKNVRAIRAAGILPSK